MRELSLTIAYNKSDVTFGWNGFNNALTLYYMSQMEEFVSKDHRSVDFYHLTRAGSVTIVSPTSVSPFYIRTIYQLDKVILWWRK